MKAYARRESRPQLSSGRKFTTRCRSRTVQCHASVIWRQLDGTKAWVAHPRAAQVKGVIHFLGGAFAGAAPQLLYNSFVELLADAGYTTIATPYAVTFRHDQCARNVRQSFVDSIQELRTAGRSYLVPPRAPQFAVGHSNGALLHLLTSSFEQGATQGNVIISYNNLQVSDAIPIPGLLDGLQPTVQAARSIDGTMQTSGKVEDNSSSSSSSGRTSRGLLPALPSSQQVLAAAASSLPLLMAQEQQLLRGATLALDQLGTVVNEVGDGLTDFRPTPQESRAIVSAGYWCPDTLMVQFEDDSIDQTPEMMRLLTERLSTLSSASTTSSSSVDDTEGDGAGSSSSSTAAWGPALTWSSVEEDMDSRSLELEWQQLQQRQQQQWSRSSMSSSGTSGSSGFSLFNANPPSPRLQQLVLPGTHITPCGAQMQAAAVGGYKRHEAALQTLADKVLLWLEESRSRPAAPRWPQVARTRQELAVLRQWAGTSSQLPSPVYSPFDSLEEVPVGTVAQPLQQQQEEQLMTVTASSSSRSASQKP